MACLSDIAICIIDTAAYWLLRPWGLTAYEGIISTSHDFWHLRSHHFFAASLHGTTEYTFPRVISAFKNRASGFIGWHSPAIPFCRRMGAREPLENRPHAWRPAAMPHSLTIIAAMLAMLPLIFAPLYSHRGHAEAAARLLYPLRFE